MCFMCLKCKGMIFDAKISFTLLAGTSVASAGAPKVLLLDRFEKVYIPVDLKETDYAYLFTIFLYGF